MTKPNEKFRFKKLDTIGSADAETDTFLDECFVDTDYLSILRDNDDHRNILVGRTGAGKTALLRQLAVDESGYSIILNPEQLALGYISNTTILPYLTKLGVNLEIFYKLLWTHSFAVHIIRHKYNLDDETTTSTWLQRLLAGAEAKKKQHAIDYLNKWGAQFWVEVDQNVKEITRTMEKEVKASLGQVSYIKVGDISALKKLNEVEKQEAKQRAQEVVNKAQVQDLHNVLDLLNSVLAHNQTKYFILIDKLDEQWVEDRIRYSLIKALIESARDFTNKTSVKIVVALRHDLLRTVFQHTRAAGHQQEKYESRIVRLVWSRGQLKEVLEKRIRTLIARRYTNQPVNLHEILSGRIKEQELVDYMIDRTLLRPRDIIKYFNCVIGKCEGRTEVRGQDVRNAESEYSESRFNALVDEWFAEMPNLSIAAQILRGRPRGFKLADITEDDILSITLLLQKSEIDPGVYSCRLFELAERLEEGTITADEFRRVMILAFYDTGLVDLKTSSHHELYSSVDGHEILGPYEVGPDTKVYVRQAFWKYLGIPA